MTAAILIGIALFYAAVFAFAARLERGARFPDWWRNLVGAVVALAAAYVIWRM